MPQNVYQQQRNSYQVLQKIYEQIRLFILNTGGDIMKFFQEVDVNRDNFVSKEELNMCMQKMGFVGTHALSNDDVSAVFLIFDENKDGRISYSELCK